MKPTRTIAGTKGRIKAYRSRAAHGEPLHHPQDRQLTDAEGLRVSKSIAGVVTVHAIVRLTGTNGYKAV